jgi:hypothetical protein
MSAKSSAFSCGYVLVAAAGFIGRRINTGRGGLHPLTFHGSLPNMLVEIKCQSLL